ncbi:hypothetical protein NOF55_05705 [Rhizobiaceae bacterium BDR2-2]|uniref:Uncharacterized protein n=1 Tax=Ectorhizobium quercum TaxID=2965071 RepID=A0AAE3SVP2_9HYPH|nr:hypothetical protein [Ectorhizobium quercum]MCX8996595.1 hypothetical protein [Ectorhizobium quercum]
MVTQTSMPASPENSPTSHPLNTPESIERLATEWRRHGDIDLPHSYYVEQVKLSLAGKKKKAASEEASKRRQAPYESSDCFRAWALGD